MTKTPISLVINSPYTAPDKHWVFTEEERPPELTEGRRQAGYMIANPRAKPHRDSGKFVTLSQVNQIRVRVESWVKNDHLSFEILYVHNGVVKKYRPDFLIQLTSEKFLIVEVKGRQREQDDTKHVCMEEWIKAVNEHGGFGQWQFAVSRTPSDIQDVLIS